jgi:hypothetical protein
LTVDSERTGFAGIGSQVVLALQGGVAGFDVQTLNRTGWTGVGQSRDPDTIAPEEAVVLGAGAPEAQMRRSSQVPLRVLDESGAVAFRKTGFQPPGRGDLVALLTPNEEPRSGPVARADGPPREREALRRGSRFRLWVLPGSEDPTGEQVVKLSHEILSIDVGRSDGPAGPGQIDASDFWFSDDGRCALLVGWTSHCLLVKLPEPGLAAAAASLVATLPDPSLPIESESPKGWVASVSPDGYTLEVRAPTVPGFRKPVPLPSRVKQLGWNRRGDLLLVVTEDGRAALWNPRFLIESVLLADGGCIAARFHPESDRFQMLQEVVARPVVPYVGVPPGVLERWELVEADLGEAPR